ncbi:hypothetical protein VTK26DRAFT_8225 [Humicola hyalothermophila]
MALYSDPPPLRQFSEDKPTLLVCWWVTSFCTVIILLRLAGRFIRAEKLFPEDRTAALALVPLFLRMGCVHVILIYGTNNAQLADAALSDELLHRRSIGSGLVLLSRVLYAATLWVLKYAILEFFRRLNVNWTRTYELAILLVRVALITTFVPVLISDLAECRPFSHYWQVLPDPGGRCRQGYAQLLTMAVCNVVTDLLLVIFPIPVILDSSMSVKRKCRLVVLFSLSLAPVAVTIYRVPHIIRDGGSQQSRSLYASIEILFATAAANTLVLGSFVRDRGVKKRRYRYDSIAAGSLDRPSGSESRRPIALRHWGSDEDLARDLGYGVTPELREVRPPSTGNRQYVPAPVVKPQQDMESWQSPGHEKRASSTDRSNEPLGGRASPSTHRRVSFFDYGGLLDDQRTPSQPNSFNSSNQSTTPMTRPRPALQSGMASLRRNSTTLLQDLSGFLTPSSGGSKAARQKLRRQSSGTSVSPTTATGYRPVRRGTSREVLGSPLGYSESDRHMTEPELMDVGGGVGRSRESR